MTAHQEIQTLRGSGFSEHDARQITGYRIAKALSLIATGCWHPRQVPAVRHRLEQEHALALPSKPGSPFCTIIGPAGITTGQSK